VVFNCALQNRKFNFRIKLFSGDGQPFEEVGQKYCQNISAGQILAKTSLTGPKTPFSWGKCPFAYVGNDITSTVGPSKRSL
jgi:hypothetical protein